MGRASVTVRVARWLQAFPLRLFRFLEWPFVAFLFRCQRPSQALFLLALPRSGSTVTYQVICHGLTVQYLSNIWNLFYQLPLLGGFLSARFARQHRSDFQSQHGFVSGLDGPAEGLRFWKWWLDCGLTDDDCENQSPQQRKRRSRYLGRVLNVLTLRAGPFATAYLGHTLAPDRVYEAFPGSALVRLHREPVSNGLSLLKSMRANNTVWFSVLPKECKGLENTSEHDRVAAQVYWLNRRLDDARCSDEMLMVRYEALCENPAKELERIRSWCMEKGIQVDFKFSLPDEFEYKMADCETNPDAMKIRKALTNLEEMHGKLEYMQ